MKLSDLQPRWVHPNIFVFLCPHCKAAWLTCKNVAMDRGKIFDILVKEFGDGDSLHHNPVVVPPKPSVAWKIEGPFPDGLTVTPSIDASESGHWHGNITNGECLP
jgi:hypothetical protein